MSSVKPFLILFYSILFYSPIWFNKEIQKVTQTTLLQSDYVIELN